MTPKDSVILIVGLPRLDMAAIVSDCLYLSYVAKDLTALHSSRTSMCFGHAFQLCRQQTVTSQPFRGRPCSRKFLLSNSNSIFTRCHRPAPTCRWLGSQEIRLGPLPLFL